MQTLSFQQADLVRLLQSRHTQHVIWVINLLLVIWIASILANLTWGLLSPPEVVEPPKTVAVSASAPVNPDRQLISQIPGWHLMGIAEQGSQPVQEEIPIEAPETKLQLILRGVLSSDDPVHARAIIADPRGKEEQYAIGKELPGNAELSEIHPDRVILKRNGRYETLRLPKDKIPSNTTASNTAASRYVSRITSGSSSRQRLNSVRQQLRQAPARVSDLIRATPKRGEDGSTIGYVLSPGRDPELFEQVGLQAGDVAIQINDIKLDNPANSARALKSMQIGESVSVTVMRNDQEEVLSLEWPEETD